jgi:hypothetical protein
MGKLFFMKAAMLLFVGGRLPSIGLIGLLSIWLDILFEYFTTRVVMSKRGGIMGFQRDMRRITLVHCRVEVQYSAGERTHMAR